MLNCTNQINQMSVELTRQHQKTSRVRLEETFEASTKESWKDAHKDDRNWRGGSESKPADPGEVNPKSDAACSMQHAACSMQLKNRLQHYYRNKNIALQTDLKSLKESDVRHSSHPISISHPI